MSNIFGNATGTSAGSSNSIFGTTGAKTDGKSLFGGTTGSTGFSFGQSSTASASGDGQSKPVGLFGGGAPSSGSLFGAKKDDKSAETNKSTFSGFAGFGAPSQTPETPAQPASTNLFGSTTPAASSNPFGMKPSTTPAGQPPAGSLFGASTGVTSQPQANTTSAFSFPKPAAPAADQQSAAASQGPSNLFSNPAKPAGASIFTNPTSTNDLSSKPATFSGFSFQKATENPQTKPAPSFSFMKPKEDDKPNAPATQADQPKLSGFALPSPSNPSSTTAQSTTSQSAAPNPFAQNTGGSQTKTPLFTPTTSSTPSGNIFAKPAPPVSQAAEAPKLGGFSFPSLGPSQPQPTSTQSVTNPAASKSLFPSLAGSTPTSSAATLSTTAPSTTTASSLFNLGGATTATAEPAATASTTPAPLFKLGGGTTSSTSPATSAAPMFNLGDPTTASTTPAQNATAAPTSTTSTATAPVAGLGTSTFSASTSGPLAPVQSRLRNKTMDEILTRWASDLTRYTKEFRNHAEVIACWDQIIVDNSAKIDKLYVKTRTCEKQTMSVEMQLSAVENQQNELEAWLSKYENDVDEMLAKDGSQPELGGPDQERERTYQLAQRLSEQVNDMGRDLQSMVEEINAANASLGKNNKADEPVTQIVKILNSHLNQLQAIDQGTSAIQSKIAAAQKAASGVSYLNNSINGDSQTAADGFYRSYMGRR